MPNKTGYEYGIALMFCLCVRIGELRALRWTDVDEYRGTITVEREFVRQRTPDRPCYYEEVNHTKGGEHGSRTLPLSDRAKKILKELKEQEVTSVYICCNTVGNHLDGNHFNEHLKKITEKVGIPYMSSHKIRFWSVTALARATGGDIQTVKYVAGHADKNTTLHYIRDVESEIKVDAIKECFG